MPWPFHPNAFEPRRCTGDTSCLVDAVIRNRGADRPSQNGHSHINLVHIGTVDGCACWGGAGRIDTCTLLVMFPDGVQF